MDDLINKVLETGVTLVGNVEAGLNMGLHSNDLREFIDGERAVLRIYRPSNPRWCAHAAK